MNPSAGSGRRFLYLSHATTAFDGAELERLVESCRRHNAERGITGILLYLDGRFGQLIEGPAPALGGVVDRIDQDPRHRDIVVLLDAPMDEPLFAGWSMAAQANPSAAASSDFAQLVAARLRRSDDPAAAEVAALLGRFWAEFAR